MVLGGLSGRAGGVFRSWSRGFGRAVARRGASSLGGRAPVPARAPRGPPAPRALPAALGGALPGTLAQQTLLAGLLADVAVQWVGWGAAAVLKTEKFYDLLGSGTFALLAVGGLVAHGTYHSRQVLVAGCVGVWAARLGTYLVARIHKDGKDKRFDKVRDDPAKFFVFWTLQAVWVWVVSLPVLIVHGAGAGQPALAALDCVGALLWAAGFATEAVADAQKDAFRANPDNKGKFIDEGLWSVSRHPNYLGEILLWSGLFLVSCRAAGGPGLVAAAACSPGLTALLLTQVSGIPLLEKAADKKWGGQPEYEEYKKRVPVLVPFTKAS